MQKQFRVPFYFLILAAVIGLVLRYHLIAPITSLVYSNWLHAHSHLMFLGWLFNFFNLVFVYYFLRDKWESRYKLLFYGNQILLIGMFVFFPLQGYSVITIVLSTLHTILSAIFCIRYIMDTGDQKKSLSRWLAVWALICFLISSLGPFSLAGIMANNLDHTKWYFFAIYFYLHFQYNGFFFFGILSVFFRQMEEKKIPVDVNIIRKLVTIFIAAVFPAYFLSILWATPGLVYNILGFAAAGMQVIAFTYFVKHLGSLKERLKPSFHLLSYNLLKLVLAAFALKFLLQVLSAFPYFAKMAYDNRYFVIAYLHLVLIGGISFFVIAWYVEKNFIKNIHKIFVMLLTAGFILSELMLIAVNAISGTSTVGSLLILSFSVIMFFGIVGFFVNLSSRQ
jgi:hypothetical protein